MLSYFFANNRNDLTPEKALKILRERYPQDHDLKLFAFEAVISPHERDDVIFFIWAESPMRKIKVWATSEPNFRIALEDGNPEDFSHLRHYRLEHLFFNGSPFNVDYTKNPWEQSGVFKLV